MPSLFGAQVAALMVKDLKIARNNRKGTAIEMLFPLLMGAMTGAFILLFNVIESGGSEYSDNDLISGFNASVGVPRWVGYHRGDLSDSLTAQTVDAIEAASRNAPSNAMFYFDQVAPMVTLQAAFDTVFDTTFNHTASAVYGALQPAPDGGVEAWGATFGDTKVAIKTFMSLGLLISNLHLHTGFNLDPTVQWLELTINLRAIFSSTGAVLLIYAFIPALTITAGRLVEDKRVKARETLKVMGCTDTAYLLASALASTLRMAVGVTLIALVLAAFGAISGSEIPLVMGISLLFAWSLIAFAQITPSVTVTPIWANVMCIVLLAGGAVVSGISTGWAKPLQLLMCLLSPVGFYYGILPSLSENTVHLLVSPSDAAVMLAIDIGLYVLIGNYLYAINPGDFGVPKHPLFFIRWIWASKEHTRRDGLLQSEAVDHTTYRVVLQNLTKFYGSSPTPSVDNLTISIKVGEIYALLGHNGAGKTTAISILTGMITPTTYDVASIDGHDIAEEMDKIRESVGLCPQFDVLFSDLSARDHLLLFARIKGVKNVEEAAQQLLDDLELPTDNQRSETFSGGMKRRLSVGNAIVGGASLLFLDEPSSGMDPLSRRQMWDLLKRQRDAGKTIVLTTHFMEEADYLGDRIAIMSRGHLFCCATSSELKHQYGTGFTLTAAKAASCNVAGIRSLLEKHVSTIKTLSDGAGDVSFELPSNQLPKFADMLTEFERDQAQLGVTSYGVTMSTLEDVFVAISTAEEKKLEKEKERDHASIHNEHHHYTAAALNDSALETIGGEPIQDIFERAQRVPEFSRIFNQTCCIFSRKFTLFRRSRRMQLMIILFPIFFLLLAFVSVQPQTASSASSFDKTDSVDETDFNYVFVSPRDQDANDKLIQSLRDVYFDRFGLPMHNVFKVEKYGDFATGLYLPVESVSFIEGFKSPKVPTGVIVHENKLDQTPPAINATLLWNPQFDAVWAATSADLFRSAIQRLLVPGSRANITIKAMPFALPTNGSKSGGGVTFDSTKLFNVMSIGMYMVLSIGQIVASCAIPASDEITRQIYHTNMALGMAPLAYFLGNFFFDLLMCVYPFLLFTLGVYWKDMESYHSGALLVCIIAGLVYCAHAILQAYVFITYLQGMKPYVYTVIIHAFNLATMGAPYLTDVALNAAKFGALDDIRPYLLSIFPSCAWYRIMDETSYFQLSKSSAGALLTFSGIRTGWTFVILILELIVPIALVVSFAKVSGLYKKWAAYREKIQAAQIKKLEASAGHGHHNGLQKDASDGLQVLTESEDSDVAAERHRIESMNVETTTDMVVMKHLRKQYGDAKVALKNLSLGIQRGECFGLLGPNGAGKSTACKLIVRQLEPSAGDVLFSYGHVNATTSPGEAFQRARLGVCQQTDTLWEYLGAAEHMDQYLRMRLTTEYDPARWTDYIQRTIERVQLAEAGQKQAGGYSGGMKRKLQVCLAMYTGARCVFLDEPSTGMDPFARRALWKVILDACRHDCCVVLTTHSMEEAEAVCGRISIITSGSLKCIGTTQHLKNKFGSGYVISVAFDATRVTPSLVQGLKDACREKFGSSFEVKEELGTLHRYGVQSLASLAEAFRFLNANASRFAVEEYSVTQTASLEQIFLSFVSTTRDN